MTALTLTAATFGVGLLVALGLVALLLASEDELL